jgi:hypothetical protein
MRSSELPQPLLDLGRIGEHPAVDGAVVDIEAALGEQALDVAAAQGIAQITAWMMSQGSKWRPLKSSLARRFSFSARAVKIIGGLSSRKPFLTDLASTSG